MSQNVVLRRDGIAEGTLFAVLAAISFSHMLNDLIQSLIPSIYPILKTRFELSFAQVGLITLTFQLTASLLQPLVGLYTDRRPLPYSLVIGMGSTMCGVLLLSQAPNFPTVLVAAALVGTGSSVFHPESSRVARLASGGRHGLAQSLFQVGGNVGSSLGPLMAAFIVVPRGQAQRRLVLDCGAAGDHGALECRTLVRRPSLGPAQDKGEREVDPRPQPPSRQVVAAVGILLVLIFSKYIYTASLNTYFTFYLIEKFHLSVQSAQVHLFVYLGAFALGTLAGGPLGDRVGRKYVIWFSILGVLPFTLMLPFANLFWTGLLVVPIGLILSSAFSAILVYAQELMPGRVGTVAGLFFGFAFGMSGLGAAALGGLADRTSIEFVYRLCAFMPAIGFITMFLPHIEGIRVEAQGEVGSRGETEPI